MIPNEVGFQYASRLPPSPPSCVLRMELPKGFHSDNGQSKSILNTSIKQNLVLLIECEFILSMKISHSLYIMLVEFVWLTGRSIYGIVENDMELMNLKRNLSQGPCNFVWVIHHLLNDPQHPCH